MVNIYFFFHLFEVIYYFHVSLAFINKPDITRKLEINISQEHTCENPQQNIYKFNPVMYIYNYTSSPSGLYLRGSRLVYQLKINQHNPSHQKAKKKNQVIISIDTEKHLTKCNIYSS